MTIDIWLLDKTCRKNESRYDDKNEAQNWNWLSGFGFDKQRTMGTLGHVLFEINSGLFDEYLEFENRNWCLTVSSRLMLISGSGCYPRVPIHGIEALLHKKGQF